MSRTSNNAFTLFELLIVLAIMGLAASLTMAYGDSLFNGLGKEPLSETLRRAVREARYQAVNTGRPVTLKWHEDQSAFTITSADGSELARMNADAEPREDSLKFYQILPGTGLDVPDMKGRRSEATHIVFAPDRSATPFVAELRWTGEESVHRFDPFSNLQLEEDQ